MKLNFDINKFTYFRKLLISTQRNSSTCHEMKSTNRCIYFWLYLLVLFHVFFTQNSLCAGTLLNSFWRKLHNHIFSISGSYCIYVLLKCYYITYGLFFMKPLSGILLAQTMSTIFLTLKTVDSQTQLQWGQIMTVAGYAALWKTYLLYQLVESSALVDEVGRSFGEILGPFVHTTFCLSFRSRKKNVFLSASNLLRDCTCLQTIVTQRILHAFQL